MKKKSLKTTRGITLIALVVTIVVLLILAGVSISMLAGENGIIEQAQRAKKETEIGEEKEKIDLAISGAASRSDSGIVTEENLIKELNNLIGTGMYTLEGEGPYIVTFNKSGRKYTIEASPNVLKAGSEVQKPSDKNWDETKVTPITDGEGNTIPVPKDFYYAGGTKDTGFVISDVPNDNLDNTAGGNQFVWIPCDEENGGVKYEKDSIKENNNLATTWNEKYSKFQGNYKDYAWKDEGGDENSVKQYGGFYIGRFEAGLPKEYWKKQEDGTYELKWDGNYENIAQLSERINIPINYTPVSKKNNPSWNGITQENAKKVSEKMYENNSSVTSQLIDSYAWDTTVEWLAIGDNKIDPTDSTSYGNYLNSEIEINGLYEEYTRDFTNVQWTLPQTYKNGYLKTERREENGLQKIYCIATGSSENTKTKNIYDLAGNNAEYTTEIGDRKKDIEQESIIGTYAVTRGGVPNMYGNILPISYRSGTLESNPQYVDLRTSFRIVLYIKSK